MARAATGSPSPAVSMACEGRPFVGGRFFPEPPSSSSMPLTPFARPLPIVFAFVGLACGPRGSETDTTAGASTVDANPSLSCVLEYQTADGVFGPAAQGDGTLTGGVTARSATSGYALAVTASGG